ncbi:MAG: ribonuclease III [Actinomycetota bacterium]|nr:ribonuclease III [Actinomycetota bacterium]
MSNSRNPARKAQLVRLRTSLAVDVTEDLLDLALTHRSFAYEHGGAPDNERLEFLGDSVLGILVTDELYRRYPELAEGQLAKIRAAVVNARALAEVARALDLGSYLLLGRGEISTGGQDKSSILADSTEAVIGAIYLTSGIGGVGEFIHRIFDPMIIASADLGAGLDWKTSLQEVCASQERGVPIYAIQDSGPDHAKEFHAEVLVAQTVLGTGDGRSKKIAEQQAAEMAYRALTHDA